MAKMTPGAIVSEVRNKIAATVFTKNRYGAAIRNRTTPINRRSTGQTEARQILSSFSSGWRGLTQAQRDGWNSAAANFPQQDNLGQTIYLTGAQLYNRCNLNLTLIGEAAIADAPSPTSFPVLSITGIIATADDDGVALSFTPTVPAGFALVVRATAPYSAGREFISQSKFRFLSEIPAAATSPQAIGPAYVVVFGSLTNSTGQKLAVEMFLVELTSGLAGQAVRLASIILAT